MPPKRGGADHRSFVRSGDVVRVVRCVGRCRRQLWNDLKRSPEEVESSGLIARDGDVDSTVPGMFRLFILQEVGGVARGPRLRSVPLKRWLTCVCLSGSSGAFVQ